MKNKNNQNDLRILVPFFCYCCAKGSKYAIEKGDKKFIESQMKIELSSYFIKTCFKNRSLTPFSQHGPLSRTRFSLMLVSFFTRRARDNTHLTHTAFPVLVVKTQFVLREISLDSDPRNFALFVRSTQAEARRQVLGGGDHPAPAPSPRLTCHRAVRSPFLMRCRQASAAPCHAPATGGPSACRVPVHADAHAGSRSHRSLPSSSIRMDWASPV